MGTLDSSIIKIDCSCGNKREINRKKQKQIFNEEITIGKFFQIPLFFDGRQLFYYKTILFFKRYKFIIYIEN
jgi:hypothetical protein